MFKWAYSEQVKTDADAVQIWTMWKNAEAWPEWDSELEWVKLEGPFKTGTKGKMQPVGGPAVDFTLIEVLQHKKFVDRARLPLTTLDFSHTYESEHGNSAYICHSVTMKGLLAPIFGFVLGRKIKKHLRASMEDLCSRACKLERVIQ